MIQNFLRYFRYSRRAHSAHLLYHLTWSLRETYWDYFPSRFDAWYDKNCRD